MYSKINLTKQYATNFLTKPYNKVYKGDEHIFTGDLPSRFLMGKFAKDKKARKSRNTPVSVFRKGAGGIPNKLCSTPELFCLNNKKYPLQITVDLNIAKIRILCRRLNAFLLHSNNSIENKEIHKSKKAPVSVFRRGMISFHFKLFLALELFDYPETVIKNNFA